ncbi:MAG: CRISPR-associated helicase Cas3' [Brevinematia bacterium]
MKSNILSHLNKHLEEHINGCLKHFRNEISRMEVDEKLKKAIEILIVCHDIGKATSYFQEYIRGGKKNIYTNHSLLSSVFAFYITKEILNDIKLAAYSFVACKNHHSDLWNSKEQNINFFLNELSIISLFISPDPNKEIAIDYLKKQADSINFDELHLFVSNLDVSDDIKNTLTVSKQKVFEWIEKIHNELISIKAEHIVSKATNRDVNIIFDDIGDYFTFLLMFSSLVFADKKDATMPTDLNFNVKPYNFNENIVEEYKKHLNTTYTINEHREKAYKEVLKNNIDKLLKDGNRFFSITLPTGMGKTLTGFAFALKLANHLKNKNKHNYRIIYALPFLSIIDQNFSVIEKVLEASDIQPTSDKIIKHHHLTEIKYRIDETQFDTPLSIEIAKLFTETWESNIIITTFIQLFLSIITNLNSSSRRLLRLAKSIIILDEVQTIPHRYWYFVREVFEELAKRFDVYVILMTATQPKILPTVELVKNKDYYFTLLDRIKVRYDEKPKTIDEFLDTYADEINNHLSKGKKVLLMCNTIRSSKQMLKKVMEKFGNYSITYLSSYVIPKHRLERIGDIKNGKYDILVSTQVVEAGVDVDFDVVYRDFAPIDSIIQASGRCNRNGVKDKGVFSVIELVYEKNGERKHYSSLVYDYFLLDCTRTVFENYFKNNNVINEKDFINMVKDYFDEIDRRGNKSGALELLDALKSLNFNKIRLFKLIEEDANKDDVFLEVDEEAVKVFQQVNEIYKEIKFYFSTGDRQGVFRKLMEYESIKAKVYQYVVSADVRDLNLPRSYFGFYYVPKNDVRKYYDPVEGFVVLQGGAYAKKG